MECPNCRGTGEIRAKEECPVCHGGGTLTITDDYGNVLVIKCFTCQGTGQVEDTDTCPMCGGSGKVLCIGVVFRESGRQSPLHWPLQYMIHARVMTCKTREQGWQEMCTCVAHMKDKLGKEVDAGITETVVVLNLLGITTTQSCEGHLDHGTGAPWVDIEDTNASERSREVNHLFQQALQFQRQQTQISNETVKLFEEAHQAKREVKCLHLAIRQKLLNYLAVFYENRQVPFDVRLVIQARDTTGRSRLESQGADFQETASLEQRNLKLALYQEEMRQFTLFLKQQYFQATDI